MFIKIVLIFIAWILLGYIGSCIVYVLKCLEEDMSFSIGEILINDPDYFSNDYFAVKRFFFYLIPMSWVLSIIVFFIKIIFKKLCDMGLDDLLNKTLNKTFNDKE